MFQRNDNGGLKFDFVSFMNLIISVIVIVASVMYAVTIQINTINAQLSGLRLDVAVIKEQITTINSDVVSMKIKQEVISEKLNSLDVRISRLEMKP